MITGPSDSPYGEYKFSGKVYRQYPLVLAQTTELMNLIASIVADQTNQETKQLQINLPALFDSLVGESLTRFLGLVLVEENETVEQLASVRSFVERGQKIAWQIRPVVVKEVMEDFFGLNKEDLGNILALFGIDLVALQSHLSEGFKKISAELRNFSPIAGDVIPAS
jgi:hypothetical protein